MELQNASTTLSKSTQLRNVNTVRWEFGNVTTQQWEINNRKSEAIAFVVNAGMNVAANNFYINFKSKKEVSLSEVFALFNWSSAGYISGIYFSNSAHCQAHSFS